MRPGWDETWMVIADTIAQRSLCIRRQAGCVLISSDNQCVAVGYNGPPATYQRPDGTCDAWCPRASTGGSMSYDDCPSVHSEANALMFADRSRLNGGTAYVTSCPCLTCAKNLANSGVTRVVFRVGEVDRDRHPEITINYLRNCQVEVVILENALDVI